MEQRIYRLGHHLVAFLDVLGQRDAQRDVLEFKISAQIRTLYLLYLIRSNSTRAKSCVTCSFNRGQVVESQRI